MGCGDSCQPRPKTHDSQPTPSASDSGGQQGSLSNKGKPVPDAEPKDSSVADGIRPVYPALVGEPEPLAQKLCEALHSRTRAKKDECCERTSSLDVTSECVRMLTFAIRSKAVVLDSAEVDRCLSAIDTRLSNCDFLAPGQPPTAPQCAGIVRGQLQEGARCRSALECKEGLNCRGVGPTQQGICSKPRGAKMACGTASDPLLNYTFQDEKKHPECEGVCGRNQCMTPVKEGESCVSSMLCPTGTQCVKGKCSHESYPGPGQPCESGLCAPHAKCVKGKCAIPKKNGEPCETLFECEAICKIAPGAKRGVCAPGCPP